jgi:SAM-dependent methyltransferase
MNPQPPPELIREHYRVREPNRLIDLYRRISSTPSVRRLCEERLDWLETLMPQRGRLLDFACADGFFFERAQQRGWDAHGVDSGEWTSEAARARGLTNLHVGALADLRFPDYYFDVVYAAQVFEHLPNPRADLEELCRILRPGGILYIDVPNYRTLPILFGRDDFVLNAPPQHLNYFVPATLRLLLHGGGLRDVRIRSTDGLKWELLLGQKTRSDIQDVYSGGARSIARAPSPKSGPPVGRFPIHIGKKFLRATVVGPVLYDGLKVGMTLAAFARRA